MPRKQKTKENQVPSHETGQEDLEAETAPDLEEGDIAVSEVSNN